MIIDENMICPVCNAKLFTDEVAYCPECGAPHHKKCFLQLGHCAYADKHGTDEQWQPPKIEPPQATEKGVEQKENPVSDEKKFEAEFNQNKVNRENAFFVVNKIDKNEDIDGISAECIAKFVGYNALRYINVFRKMAKSKNKISWNWIAFLFPELWLISRKCYFQAIFVSFYSVLYNVFYLIAENNSNFRGFSVTGVITEDIKNIVFALTVGFFIMSAIRVFMGLFGDFIYKKKVYSTIKQMHEEGSMSDMDFIRKGSVNLFLPILLHFCINVLSLIIFWLI